jgi:hypothetical protein
MDNVYVTDALQGIVLDVSKELDCLEMKLRIARLTALGARQNPHEEEEFQAEPVALGALTIRECEEVYQKIKVLNDKTLHVLRGDPFVLQEAK